MLPIFQEGIEMKAFLKVKDGKLQGIALQSSSTEGEELISSLLKGDVEGLPYCENTQVMPVAVARDMYLIEIGHEGPPPTGNPAID